MTQRDFVLVYINGKAVEVRGDKTAMMLADYLRYEQMLTGTKIVCAEGDCGACTVLRRSHHQEKYEAINSCITTMAQMDTCSLVTVDALDQDGRLSPVQESMVACHASQCGFCTPGFVMALTALTEKKLSSKNFKITEQEAKNSLTGNLCRCTGYQPILEAACETKIKDSEPISSRFWTKQQATHLNKIFKTPIFIEGQNFIYYAPKSLKDASSYLAKNRDAKIISGGTDLGVLTNKGRFKPSKYLSLHLIKELYDIRKSKNKIRVGSRVTLSEVRRICKGAVPEFARFLDLFASPQIKNVATLAGNIGNASPIADTPPFLFATNAVKYLAGPTGIRAVPIDSFYLDYKKTALKKGEFIAFIEFEIPHKTERFSLYKSSQRKDLDISCVNAAFRLKFEDQNISNVRIALGGVGPIPLRIKTLEKFLLGKKIDQKLIDDSVGLLQKSISPISDLRGSAAFRFVTAENFLRKFFSENLSRRASR